MKYGTTPKPIIFHQLKTHTQKRTTNGVARRTALPLPTALGCDNTEQKRCDNIIKGSKHFFCIQHFKLAKANIQLLLLLVYT